MSKKINKKRNAVSKSLDIDTKVRVIGELNRKTYKGKRDRVLLAVSNLHHKRQHSICFKVILPTQHFLVLLKP